MDGVALQELQADLAFVILAVVTGVAAVILFLRGNGGDPDD